MDFSPEYITENEDVIRRSTLYIMQGHDPDRYWNLVEFAKPFMATNGKILSIGCSGFEPTLYHATHAIDISPIADRFLKYNDWKGVFAVGSVTHLPYENQEFDLAICSEVIEHLPTDNDVRNAFLEISRVAKNWLITTPASPIPEPTHKRFWPIEIASQWAAQFDAVIVRVNLWWFIYHGNYTFQPLDIPATSGPNASIRPGDFHA